ncbi:MAG TPA: JAB domain-containing protein [Actinomycetes bacterium]|nr:JAB domain-containing protein [Actinomycetes bacterium]
MTTDIEFVRLHLDVERTKRLHRGGLAIAELVKELGLHTQTQEVVWAITYGENGNLYRIIEVNRGFHNHVDLDLSSLFTAVVATSAPMFSIAHNHPTMLAIPSVSDNNLTEKVMTGANALGLVFEDHVVVEPGGDWYSYREAGRIIGDERKTPKAASRRKR